MKGEDQMFPAEGKVELKDPMEHALLCGLFLDKAAIPDVATKLRPEMFTDPFHELIYQAFLNIYNRGKQPDMRLVDVEMKMLDMSRAQKMGGIGYISERMEDVRLEHNISSYADEIKRRYNLKQLHLLFKWLSSESMQFDADYLEVVKKCYEALSDLRRDFSVSNPLVTLGELANESIGFQINRMQHRDDPVRMLTGLRELDGLTGGAYRGEVIVLGGLPSDGKTALAMAIAMNIARSGKHVLHFSLEMTGNQTISRLFAGYGGVDVDRMRIGGLRECDLQKMRDYAGQIEPLPYYFVNNPIISIQDLRAEILLKARVGKCDFVLVDYIQLMVSSSMKKNETMESVVGGNIQALKQIATEANCAMLVVSQLNREIERRWGEGSEPRMSDLRDSGRLEQAADCVIILNRPMRYLSSTNKKACDMANLLRLFVLKNRNGATGIAEVYYNHTFTQFLNKDSSLPFKD